MLRRGDQRVCAYMIDAAWLHATQEWLDWEFPACRYDPADWDNYLLLLRTYREALDTAWPSVHKELSIAMGMGSNVTGVAPKAELAALADAVSTRATYPVHSHTVRAPSLAGLLSLCVPCVLRAVHVPLSPLALL